MNVHCNDSFYIKSVVLNEIVLLAQLHLSTSTGNLSKNDYFILEMCGRSQAVPKLYPSFY